MVVSLSPEDVAVERNFRGNLGKGVTEGDIYRSRLERSGWKFRENISLVNELIDYSSSIANMRLLKSDLENMFSHSEKVRLARAYDHLGDRVSSRGKKVEAYTKER